MQFEKHTVLVPYKREEREYNVHFRPLMQWALNLVDHPRLAPQFIWDAERISKYNGYKWVRVYHEPWTADHWWQVQVSHSRLTLASCFTNIMFLSSSPTCHLMQVRCASAYTQTKRSSLRLAQKKDTP